MTVVVQHPTRLYQDSPGIVRRRVTGTPSEITATVALLRESGILVSASAPRQLDPLDTRVTVLCRVRDGIPAAYETSRRARPRRWVKPVVIAASVLVLVSGLLIGGYLAARQIVTTASGLPLAAVGFLAVVGLLVLLVGAGRSKGLCMGLHCSGCGHR